MSDEPAASPEPRAPAGIEGPPVPPRVEGPPVPPRVEGPPVPPRVEGPPVPPRVEVPPLLAGNGAFLATLALAAAGFAYTALVPEHWLRGVLVAAGGFLMGAALRLALPDDRAGMLRIRSKALDVLCFGAVAVLIVTVGVLLPH